MVFTLPPHTYKKKRMKKRKSDSFQNHHASTLELTLKRTYRSRWSLKGPTECLEKFIPCWSIGLLETSFFTKAGMRADDPQIGQLAVPTALFLGHASNLTMKTMGSDDLTAHQRTKMSARWKRATLFWR